ncbi:fam-a protein [Plasmodium yoelii yoelii]|uniref:Fam-a protein n=1 Tax=Plasmodium yoelii yoelii TaxID=73239 RepID=A0AAE9WW84_PLAYO|nr:fam-a protein [Plasmodium yoelii yoelii]
MWLSDNLYKIQNNGKFTLKEPYEKHLDKYIGYFNYWKIVNNGLKDANHRNMQGNCYYAQVFVILMEKEIEEKKNEKVINSIGGKRPIQIIIKSVDTKKMTNPVINPIRGKKYNY